MTEASAKLLVASLGEFFKDSVEQALRNQRVETTQETEFYLVNLLETFSKAERFHGTSVEDQPLALVLRRAVESPPDQAISLYRQIGDQSLYVSGFFSRNLERRQVSQRYYREMGQGAYETLSDMMQAKRDAVFAELYAELATKFSHLVEVLIEISETHAFAASNHYIDLIERWAATGSERAGQRLIRDGYLPLWRFATDDNEPEN